VVESWCSDIRREPRYYDRPPEGVDVAKVLKDRHITPFIAHYEADPVVNVAKGRALLDYFRERGVQHTGIILSGGDHRVSDRIKDEARRFIDAHSCRVATATCPR
jgi:predicted esterase